MDRSRKFFDQNLGLRIFPCLNLELKYLGQTSFHTNLTYEISRRDIHFAGTVTSVEWCGYMSGAVQSGYRAVAEMLQDLQPTALKAEDLTLIKKAHSISSSREASTNTILRCSMH